MNKLFLSAAMALSSMFAAHVSQADSKWVRLGWQGDASSEATISFTADGSNNNAYVSYGYSSNENNWYSEPVTFTSSMASITSKHVRLNNLNPDAEVYFRICDDGGCGERFWFKTAANDNSPFVFVAGGDTRTGWTNRQDGNRLIAKVRPLFVMHGGDFTDANNYSQWRQWLIDWELSYSSDNIDGLSYKRIYPMISTHGNHEDGDISTICKMLGVDVDRNNSCSAYDSFYTVDVSPLLRIYTLNSQFMNRSSSLQNAQNNWLRSDLANNGASAIWRIAQYHKPMFPHYSGKSDNHTLFNWWAQDFYDYGMNLVVESDTHLTKLTEVVAPSGNGFAGADQGVRSGTVYVGEGSWGAPARSANDAKSWTMDLASIQQFKVISVDATQMQLRTAQFNGSPASLSKATRDADATALPSGVNWWVANNVGDVMTLESDANNRSVLAGSAGSGNATTLSIEASMDTFISSAHANNNYNASSDQLLADGADNYYGEMQSLIAWDVSAIPSCASIELVKVELNLFDPSSGSYSIFAGTNNWQESSVSWNSVNGDAQQGEAVGSFTPGSKGFYSVQLNSAGSNMVKSWVNGNSNAGIVIASAGTSNGIDINDRESGKAPVLRVTYNEDNCGGSSNQAPTANFSSRADELDVAFSDASSDSDGSVVLWRWDFGDGYSSSAKNPRHRYARAGTYRVTLSVSDNDGASATRSKDLSVSSNNNVSQSIDIRSSEDTYISRRHSNSNFEADGYELLADGYDLSYGEMQILIKWDVSAVPACATIESAELDLDVFDASSGNYNLFAGNKAWSAASATWNSVGGNDLHGQNIGSFVPGSTRVYKVSFNASGVAAVQQWLNGDNYGLVIASGGTSNGLDIHDLESGKGPLLRLRYNKSQCAN
ncbi:DNRLRE domain-containing protein [Agaribacterium haliotis]|uniref:DNRLRE domain-containing protein n=1 Tax=Agaribacterium haliotis TaxID=2013869 RepID=UPI000BB55A13|nr:DNRLRE domain-containing protein [Agaribacterium haliotis]